jgi:CBS domain-containing protein
MATIVQQLLMHKGRRVHSLEPHASVREAVALFGTYEIGAVLICQEGKVLGVLSERDCMRKVLWQAHHSLDSKVSEVMRIDSPYVSLTDSIQHCMGLMNDRRTRHLPVVEEGRVVGIVSMGDVIHSMLGDQQHLIESLEDYITGSPSVRPPAH